MKKVVAFTPEDSAAMAYAFKALSKLLVTKSEASIRKAIYDTVKEMDSGFKGMLRRSAPAFLAMINGLSVKMGKEPDEASSSMDESTATKLADSAVKEIEAAWDQYTELYLYLTDPNDSEKLQGSHKAAVSVHSWDPSRNEKLLKELKAFVKMFEALLAKHGNQVIVRTNH